MNKPIPDYPIDIFTPDAVRNAREVDDALREFAPVVRILRGKEHLLERACARLADVEIRVARLAGVLAEAALSVQPQTLLRPVFFAS